MGLSMRQKIIAIRTDFESGNIPRYLLAKLYSQYNPTIKIDPFINEAANLFPKLNCGLASAYLQYSLGKGIIINGSYGDHNHTFLSLGETIVDITADQFGGPKIYIGPLRAPWSQNQILPLP